ncbi:protein ABHD11-like [Microplitis mediator]|uniref:protein ABHD11-like n=1 Tax=Microplitis mediator TaxID=375433 RepID=UPI002554BF1C|nr:protein ABHD11-like [Microplitis mediator]
MLKVTNKIKQLTKNKLIFKCPKKLLTRQLHVSNYLNDPVKLSYVSYDTFKSSSELSPVIIMHGLFGSKNNWNSLAKSINQQTKRQVITVDARNHGESPHSPEMNYPEMAGDVKKLINDLNFKKSICVGHSMGGAVMMLTALNYPELIEKLIVVDMSPIKTSPSLYEMTKIIDALRAIDFKNYKTLSEARKGTDQKLAGTIDSLSLRQFLITNIMEVTQGEYKWRVNLNVIADNFDKNIARFPELVPNLKNKVFDSRTLFIAGGNSDYVKREDEDKIRKLFPKVDIKYIEGAGHWVQSEKPAEFLRIACDFINT